jgi:hypothetical protein
LRECLFVVFDLLLNVASKLKKDVSGAGDGFGSGSRKAASNDHKPNGAGLGSVGVDGAFC